MKFDSVFAQFTDNPFPRDRPEIPAEDILDVMERVSNATSRRLYELLEAQLEVTLNRAYPFVVRRDFGAIASLTWNLQNQFQVPIYMAWQGGWAAGGRQMLEEIRASAPRGRFAATREEVQSLMQLDPVPLEGNPAVQAVRDRVFVLAGRFADDQLKRLRNDLIDSIEPNPETGKVLSRRELEKRIQDNLQVGKARAQTIAQTETTKAYNTGRVTTALQSDLVTHFRFIAIDDSKVTDICKSRSGLVIPRDRVAELMPPLHFRCRSTISPLMPVINPRHEEMVNDRDRQIENRALAPLPKGWRTDGGSVRRLESDQGTGNRDTHSTLLAAGERFVGEDRLRVLDEAIIPSQRLSELQRRQRQLDSEVEELLEDDSVNAFKTETGREWVKLENEIRAERQRSRVEPLNVMERLRSDILDSSQLSRAEADQMAAKVKILKPATEGTTEKLLRDTIAEFYQLTEGRGANILKKISYRDSRAWADDSDGELNIGKQPNDDSRRRVMFHEIGHFFEVADKEVGIAAESWVRARASGGEERLSVLTGDEGYPDSERAIPDYFIDPYVGKLYGDNTGEAISMGIEKFRSAESMMELYEQDKEHFLLILGALRR